MKMPNFEAKVQRRSDEDLLKIFKMAVKKYNMMGSLPIIPYTESEFRRVKDLIELGIQREKETNNE